MPLRISAVVAAEVSTMSRPQMTVDELMTTTVNALHGTDPLVRAREVMESEHVRQVPIVDTDGGVIGMLATGDLARALASGRGEAVEIEAHMARAVLTVRRETRRTRPRESCCRPTSRRCRSSPMTITSWAWSPSPIFSPSQGER
jgi:predicted transcriptional regulator